MKYRLGKFIEMEDRLITPGLEDRRKREMTVYWVRVFFWDNENILELNIIYEIVLFILSQIKSVAIYSPLAISELS